MNWKVFGRKRSWHNQDSPGETEKNNDNLGHNSPRHGRDSNRASSEYESRVSRLGGVATDGRTFHKNRSSDSEAEKGTHTHRAWPSHKAPLVSLRKETRLKYVQCLRLLICEVPLP
jgi:hypothetical protein